MVWGLLTGVDSSIGSRHHSQRNIHPRIAVTKAGKDRLHHTQYFELEDLEIENPPPYQVRNRGNYRSNQGFD